MVEVRRRQGTPRTVGELTVTPEARALIIRLPTGGFVWNRPTAVLVERRGRVERIPIHDVTRIGQLGVLVLQLLLALAGRHYTER
jgi:hypothetical protein